MLRVCGATLVLIFLICSGCNTRRLPPVTESGGKVYLSMTDKQGDDHGPGRYAYPDDKAGFIERGSFDITDFQVYDAGKEVYFRIRVAGRLNNPGAATLQNGWTYQMIDIYIDTDRITGSGYREALPGRNVVFATESHWDKMIVISPAGSDRMRHFLSNKPEHFRLREMLNNKTIIVPDFYFVSHSTIIAKILKRDLGEPQANWGYQALMLGYDESNWDPDTFLNMEVRTWPDYKSFGGGDEFSGDPNVIDMLERVNGEQEKLLSSYSSYAHRARNEYAIVPMIYSGAPVTKAQIPVAEAYSAPVEPVSPRSKSNQAASACRNNMKELLLQAGKYWREHPDDLNVTVYDLLLNGYIVEIPKCPAGGKYDIFGEEENKLQIKCYNPNGEAHGILKEDSQ
ncbi:MAG: glucodextranase DOMON-like domain-containing protein [Candidatus Wallbacteria bacterium]|nr:glucodextranase DOMON-like domain-containing protein [Candidatus Wallbacteria bacterium]